MDVLRLPSVPVSKILSHLEFKEVIQLAFLSERATNMVLAAGSCSATPPIARLCCENIRDSITLFRANRTRFVCYLRENEEFETRTIGLSHQPVEPIWEWKDQVINGVKKRVCMQDYSLGIIGAGAEDFLFMFKFLKRIFGFRTYCLFLRFKNDADFQKLMVQSSLLHKGNRVDLDTTDLSPEHLAFIVDNCSFEEFVTHGSLPEDFQYGSKLSKYQELFLDHSSERGREVPGRMEEWMTMDQIWAIANSGTTRRMELYPLNYTSEDVNGFIKNWLASDNRTFEYLKLNRVKAKRESDPLNEQVVFNGIQSFLGLEKSKTAMKKYETRLHSENGMDIRRQDGLWATVLFYKNNDKKEVHFVVWHDENPNA